MPGDDRCVRGQGVGALLWATSGASGTPPGGPGCASSQPNSPRRALVHASSSMEEPPEHEAQGLLSAAGAAGSRLSTFESEIGPADKFAHVAACRALQVMPRRRRRRRRPQPPPLAPVRACQGAPAFRFLRDPTSCRHGAKEAGNLQLGSSCLSCTHPRSCLWVRAGSGTLCSASACRAAVARP